MKKILKLTEQQKTNLLREHQNIPTSSGKTQYLRFLNGEALTYRQAALAKCYECCGGFSDGRFDCQMPQ